MRVFDEAIETDWTGPLEAVADLPGVVLLGLVLVFQHAAGKEALAAVRAALGPLLGEGEPMGLLRRGWRWTRLPVAAQVGRNEATLRFGQRIKPERLAALVRALATVPGARDLRLRGAVRRFGAPGPDGPMLDS